MATFTYVGDEEEVTNYGIRFVHGEPTEVPDNHDKMAKFVSNGQFVAADGDEDGLASFTVPELKDYAESKSIDLGEAKKKAEILAAIRAA